jgi:DNA mismatch endonuclease, patch repair protein
MTDNLTPEQRRYNMLQIRSRNTRPELTVRSIVHRMGYRYRLHCSDLAGKPDLVFPRRRKIIFIHGCFWHKHKCRYGKVIPKTNMEYWQTKRERNAARDKRNRKSLEKEGWEIFVVWECWIRNKDTLKQRLASFLMQDAEFKR